MSSLLFDILSQLPAASVSCMRDAGVLALSDDDYAVLRHVVVRGPGPAIGALHDAYELLSRHLPVCVQDYFGDPSAPPPGDASNTEQQEIAARDLQASVQQLDEELESLEEYGFSCTPRHWLGLSLSGLTRQQQIDGWHRRLRLQHNLDPRACDAVRERAQKYVAAAAHVRGYATRARGLLRRCVAGQGELREVLAELRQGYDVEATQLPRPGKRLHSFVTACRLACTTARRAVRQREGQLGQRHATRHHEPLAGFDVLAMHRERGWQCQRDDAGARYLELSYTPSADERPRHHKRLMLDVEEIDHLLLESFHPTDTVHERKAEMRATFDALGEVLQVAPARTAALTLEEELVLRDELAEADADADSGLAP